MDFDQAMVEHTYRPTVARHAAFYFGLPAPVPLLMAQIMQESSFNPAAKSRTGAAGLLQFMPQTATWAASAGALGPVQPYDAGWAIKAGAWYLRFLFDRVVYLDDCDKFGAALSAYNGGNSWQQKRQQLADDPFDFWDSVRTINPGISAANQHENENYPLRVVYKLQPQFYKVGDRVVCP